MSNAWDTIDCYGDNVYVYEQNTLLLPYSTGALTWMPCCREHNVSYTIVNSYGKTVVHGNEISILVSTLIRMHP